MKVSAINFRVNANNNLSQSANTTIKQNAEYTNSESLVCNYKNYVIPFTGRKSLPEELPYSVISECNPVNERGKHTDKLSAVLSTALSYISPQTPVLLGASDRNLSFDYIVNIFADKEQFPEPPEMNSVIFVEDDRIIDDPVLFIKNKNNELVVLGDLLIKNKETGKVEETYPDNFFVVDPERHNIKLYKTDIRPISIGEYPASTDLKFVKRFAWPDVISKEFPDSGRIHSGGFSSPIIKKAAYKPAEYPMFKDIGGNKEAIQKVIENIYAPMAFPDIFGHQMNKGTILEGPSGTGKSMLGIALRNELSKKLKQNVHLQQISGAAMQTSAVGGSESNWRNLFDTAIKNQPALIVIDEIDACIRKRDDSSNARFDNQVVDQILTLMSDLEKSDHNVHVIGMTNWLSAIDPAMLRNGRFGYIITVGEPNFDEAKEIYYKVAENYNIDADFDVDKFIREIVRIKGTGSTIAGTLENAQKYARRRNGVFDYNRLLYDDITKEEVDNCVIMKEDIEKAFQDEKDKLKKAKISSDRVVIKGFSI